MCPVPFGWFKTGLGVKPTSMRKKNAKARIMGINQLWPRRLKSQDSSPKSRSSRSSTWHPKDFDRADRVFPAALFMSLAPDSYCCRVLRFTPDIFDSSLWEYPHSFLRCWSLLVGLFWLYIELRVSAALLSEASCNVEYSSCSFSIPI